MARRVTEISQEQYETAFMLREDGATKRAQCDALGINYNTSRLDKLLDEESERREHSARMRREMRKKAITPVERAGMIQEYLQGIPLSGISDSYYRSTATVKDVLETAGVLGLMCSTKVDPLNPVMVPDACFSEEFEVGQIVFVPAYKCVGVVKHSYGEGPEGCNQYRVYLSGSRERNVYASSYDLGSLEHLKTLGVNVDSLLNDAYLSGDECKVLLAEALKKMKMQANKGK